MLTLVKCYAHTQRCRMWEARARELEEAQTDSERIRLQSERRTVEVELELAAIHQKFLNVISKSSVSPCESLFVRG